MFSKEYFQSLESSWDRLKTCEKPIFIYGMGDGAEKLLDEFDRLLVETWFSFLCGETQEGVLVLCRFGDIAVADELSVICRIEVDGGCRSVVLYSLVGNTASFTRLVGGDGDCRIDGCE